MTCTGILCVVLIGLITKLNSSFIRNRPENGVGRILISKHEEHDDYNLERLMVIFSTDCQGIYDENDNENIVNIFNTKMDILESFIVDENKCLTRHGQNKYYKYGNKNKHISFLNINRENLNCIHSESIEFDYNQHCVDMFSYEPIFYLNNNEYECISQNTASSKLSRTYPWGLNSISHGLSYNETKKGNYLYRNTSIDNGVDLFIIDSGVLSNHIEFYDNQVIHKQGDGPAMFKPYIDDDNTYFTWYADHGTHVAGIAGGINYGASKGLKIYDYRVCIFPAEANNYDDHPCYANLFFDAFDGIIVQLTNNKGRRGVINISIGGSRIVFTIYQFYFNMITSLGGILVISAGNDNHDSCLNEPAYSRSAITVGAYNVSRQKAYFSNYGKCVDIWAPGVGIWSSVVVCPGCDACGTCIGHKDGTSMATPFITGMIANILYVNPTLSFSQIKTILNQNRIKIEGEQCNSNKLPCYGAVYQCNNTYNNISDYIETNMNITNQITPKDDYQFNSRLTNAYNCSAMVVYEYDANGKYSRMLSYGINQCYSERRYQGATPYSYVYQCNYTNNSVNVIAYENSTDCSTSSEPEIVETFYNQQFDGLFKYFINCNPKSNHSICNIKKRLYSTLTNTDCMYDEYKAAAYNEYMYIKGLCYDGVGNGTSYTLRCSDNRIYMDFYDNHDDSDSLVSTCNANNLVDSDLLFMKENDCKYDSKENVYNDYVIDCGVDIAYTLNPSPKPTNTPFYPQDEYNFNAEYSNIYNCSTMITYRYYEDGSYKSMSNQAVNECISRRLIANRSASSTMYRCNFINNTVDLLLYNNSNCSSTPNISKTFHNGDFDTLSLTKYFINCNPNAHDAICNIKIRTIEASSNEECLHNYPKPAYWEQFWQKGICLYDGENGKSKTTSCANNTLYIDNYYNGNDSDKLVTRCNPTDWSSRENLTWIFSTTCNSLFHWKSIIDCGQPVPFTFDPTPRPTSIPTVSPTAPIDEYNFNNQYSNIYNCSALIQYTYNKSGTFSAMSTYAVDQCYSQRIFQNGATYSLMNQCNFEDNSINILRYTNNTNCSSTPQVIKTIRNGEFDGRNKYFVNCNSNANDTKCIIKTRQYDTFTLNDCLYHNHTGAKYSDSMYIKGLCYDSTSNGKSYQLTCINNTIYADIYYDADNNNDTLVTSCNPYNFQERTIVYEENKCTFDDTNNLYANIEIDCGQYFAFTLEPTLKPTIYPDEEYDLNNKYTNPYNCSVVIYLKYESGEYSNTYSGAINHCYSERTSSNEQPYSFQYRCNYMNNTIHVLHYINDSNCSSIPLSQKTIRNGEYDGKYKYFIYCNPNSNDDFCNIKVQHFQPNEWIDCEYHQTEAKYTQLFFQKGVCIDSVTDGYSYIYKCIDNVLYRDHFLQQKKDSFITTCDPLNWAYSKLIYQESGCQYNSDTNTYDSYVIDCGATLTPTIEPTVNPTMEPTVNPSVKPTYAPSVGPTLILETTMHPTMEPTTEPILVISTTESKTHNNGTDDGDKWSIQSILIISGVSIVIVVIIIILGVCYIQSRRKSASYDVYYELKDNDGTHKDDQVL